MKVLWQCMSFTSVALEASATLYIVFHTYQNYFLHSTNMDRFHLNRESVVLFKAKHFNIGWKKARNLAHVLFLVLHYDLKYNMA